MQRRDFLLGLGALCATPLTAAPRRYGIGGQGARIAFTFTLNGAPVTGEVPLARADMRIDPNNLAASTVEARADVTRARTGLIFATEAMKSEGILHVARFPEARFVSTDVQLGPGGRISNGASIAGRLTLRGVTQPIRLAAEVYRPRGSAQGDFSRLDVRLSGTLSRAAFGMTGYQNLVPDKVSLSIRADVAAAA